MNLEGLVFFQVVMLAASVELDCARGQCKGKAALRFALTGLAALCNTPSRPLVDGQIFLFLNCCEELFAACVVFLSFLSLMGRIPTDDWLSRPINTPLGHTRRPLPVQ